MSEEILLKDGVEYKLWTPENEPNDFEPMIKYHIKDIFGNGCEYFSKQKLKTLAGNRSIPDGFVIDFENKKWYIVELKLLCDDAVKRISGQIVQYKNAIRNPRARRDIYKSIKSIKDASFLDDLINDEEPEIVIIIDSLDGKLGEQFREQVEGTDRDVKILVFKTFAREHVNHKMVHVHLFEPVYEIESAKIETKRLVDYGIAPTPIEPKIIEEAPVIKLKRARKGEKTNQKVYMIPILGSLIKVGGSGRISDILSRVEQKMKGILKDIDYEKLPSGASIRWKNTAMWARNTMVRQGLLKPLEESGHGIWEISDKGRKYYEENKDKWDEEYLQREIK